MNDFHCQWIVKQGVYKGNQCAKKCTKMDPTNQFCCSHYKRPQSDPVNIPKQLRVITEDDQDENDEEVENDDQQSNCDNGDDLEDEDNQDNQDEDCVLQELINQLRHIKTSKSLNEAKTRIDELLRYIG